MLENIRVRHGKRRKAVLASAWGLSATPAGERPRMVAGGVMTPTPDEGATFLAAPDQPECTAQDYGLVVHIPLPNHKSARGKQSTPDPVGQRSPPVTQSRCAEAPAPPALWDTDACAQPAPGGQGRIRKRGSGGGGSGRVRLPGASK